MKTISKILTSLAIAVTVTACAAYAADQPSPQTWTPGWRHEQMTKMWQAKTGQDGTFTPGNGPGYGRGMGPGMGPGMGRGMMAAATGPDGKIDPTKLPEGCPYRESLTK